MSAKKFAEANEVDEVDVVIVGAGIAGLYCALRLFEDDNTRRITIVERLNRTGGRLDTDIIDFAGGFEVREEEGGMRFNYAMDELMNLTNRMGLCDQIVPFPMSSDGSSNRLHLRNRTFTQAEAGERSNEIWAEIYDLNEDELGLSPTDIVGQAFTAVLAANNFPVPEGPEDWTVFREACTWRGVTLNNWQMWGLLRDMGHSGECIHMLSETIGFAGPFKGPINAGCAFQILADFPKDPSYFTFQRGFATLPDAIASSLEAQFGDQFTILLSTNVDEIRREEDGFRFELTEAPHDRNSNPFIRGGTTKELSAPTTVIAVATAGMEKLFASSPALNAHPEATRLWTNMHAARGMELMKINLYFEEAWWENGSITPPVQFGPNFSSLPVNAVYPFYSLSGDASIPDGPAALTIYCDFNNTNFWAGLQNVEPKFSSEMQAREDAHVPQRVYGASQAVVDEAKKQLGLLFGLESVPNPVLTSYRCWDGTDDFEYAYHQWRPGVNDREVRAYLSNPIPGVYFCNEAISDMQGWVNGSLRSSDAALAHFGIEPLAAAPCTSPNQTTDAEHAAEVASGKRVTRQSGVWGA